MTRHRSLAEEYPEIADDWHPTLNGNLTPFDFSSMSAEKVWWICKNGHEWQARINGRTASGHMCPYCSHKKSIVGFNDLETISPEMASEWDYTKNGDLKPSDCTPGSRRNVWWVCKNGHEWQAQVYSRYTCGIGCPYCSGRKPIVGLNDLETLHPELVKEWDYTKNGDLKPSDCTCKTAKRVWWVCSICGFEWESSIINRTKGHGCPNYVKHRLINNSLFDNHPEIAFEWNNRKNNGLLPTDIKDNSRKNVWWKCPICGTDWYASPRDRVLGKKCPICNPYKDGYMRY